VRHRKRTNNFSRHPQHREAMMANLACSLIEKGRVITSPQKAKAVRPLVERMITLGKKGTVSARRVALRRLRQKGTVKRLFDKIAPLFADRPGGYTLIIRLPRTIRLTANESGAQWRRAYGLRLGDAGERCYFELVGYAPPKIEAKKPKGAKAAVEPPPPELADANKK
jgi:large subunit ribosomal protein L17